MIVCNLTTPAQLFHALRRQVKRDFRKPLVIMSPKSLLRHPQAISTLDGLHRGAASRKSSTIPSRRPRPIRRRSASCSASGKVYYDLLAERDRAASATTSRSSGVEQLYPWPAQRARGDPQAAIKNAKRLVWVQEEPRNMGAWSFVFNLWSGGLRLFQERSRRSRRSATSAARSAPPRGGLAPSS